MHFGIIGFGFIGQEVYRFIEQNYVGKAKVTSIHDIDTKSYEEYFKNYDFKPHFLTLDELIDDVDIVIESCVGTIVPELVRLCIHKSKDMVVMSVGGLILEPGLLDEIQQSSIQVYIPSGAIGGLDLLKAASKERIDQVLIRTKKPLKGLLGAPFFDQSEIDIHNIQKETLLYQGPAMEAIKLFPKNVNVAVSLSLAGIGFAKTRVEILTAPDLQINSHEIIIEGSFGKMSCLCENEPSPTNPKTSWLAALSCQALIERILSPLQIGT